MIARRSLLRTAIGVTGGLVGGPVALALAAPTRRLSFNNLHTGETLDDVAYFENGAYVSDALSAVNHVLRDYRTGDVHVIEPKLLDLLVVLSASLETEEPVRRHLWLSVAADQRDAPRAQQPGRLGQPAHARTGHRYPPAGC